MQKQISTTLQPSLQGSSSLCTNPDAHSTIWKQQKVYRDVQQGSMFLEVEFSRQFSTGYKKLFEKNPVLFYHMVTSLLLPQVYMFNSDDENITNIIMKGKKK